MEDKNPQKLKIGITGGIGCGQTLVARILHEKYGAEMISLDKAGRTAIEDNLQVQQQLRKAFGDEYFDAAGHLLRARLAQLVFSDATQRNKLNRIVHPVMLQIAFEEMTAALRRPSRAPYIILDAALLYELQLEKQMDRVVVVTAPLAQRLQRIMARDGLSPEQAQQRIDSQWPLEEKVRRADYVLDNDDTMEALMKKVDHLHRWIMRQIKIVHDGAK